MKSFAFRLATVLNLRAREEDQACDDYAQAVRARAGVEAGIQQARTTVEVYHAALRTEREGVSDRQHQLVFLNALKHQQVRCDLLAVELAAAEREVAARRHAMIGARRRREALTLLRTKQQTAHNAAAARAEESMIGDLITARHALGKMEAAT